MVPNAGSARPQLWRGLMSSAVILRTVSSMGCLLTSSCLSIDAARTPVSCTLSVARGRGQGRGSPHIDDDSLCGVPQPRRFGAENRLWRAGRGPDHVVLEQVAIHVGRERRVMAERR